MTCVIKPMLPADADAVDALLDAAFGTDRHARTAYRIRDGMQSVSRLCFTAWQDDCLAGSLQSWPIMLSAGADGGVDPDPSTVPMILVGPVAVSPAMQRSGIGRALMTALIAARPVEPLVMIGDPEYYGRFFGFSADATQGWTVPGPVERRRLLARHDGELPKSGALGPRHAFFCFGAISPKRQ
jgi:predicted N-acetyltransferase YhbS